MGFAERRKAMFAEDLAATKPVNPVVTSGPGLGAADEDGFVRTFDREVSISTVRLEENIERGQSVWSFVLSGAGDDGKFEDIVRGSTIGCARLERFAPRVVKHVRLIWSNMSGRRADVKLRLFA